MRVTGWAKLCVRSSAATLLTSFWHGPEADSWPDPIWICTGTRDTDSDAARCDRTFSARPIFSTDEPHADKHKMERYLQHGHGVVATVYGPISFPPQPVLLFRTSSDGDHALVATGDRTGSPLGTAH